MEYWEYLLILLGALGAGFVNALAGGGTLITFPLLTFLGIPAVNANITNTVALCPGYFGGTWAQRKDLKGQSKKLMILLPISLAGGLVGGLLLIFTEEKLFRELVPWLILFATLLLAFQNLIKKALKSRSEKNIKKSAEMTGTGILAFPATVYGGYFGAGLGVILLAFLGLTQTESLTRLNALKQIMSLTTNLTAAVFFLFSGFVEWQIAGIMAGGAIVGGFIGGKLAGKVRPEILRWTVVSIGIIVAIILFIKK